MNESTKRILRSLDAVPAVSEWASLYPELVAGGLIEVRKAVPMDLYRYVVTDKGRAAMAPQRTDQETEQ